MDIVWFREDLRVADNPALHAAAPGPLLCIYILDEASEGLRPLGGAARWRLHKSLERLSQQLRARGGRLDIYRGEAFCVLRNIFNAARPNRILWTRRYAPTAVAVDVKIKEAFSQHCDAVSFNGKLLIEPWDNLNATKQPYKVFTPFWRAARAKITALRPMPAPQRLTAAPLATTPELTRLDQLRLTPKKPDWSVGFATQTLGEMGARARLSEFLDEDLRLYAKNRDFPGVAATSRLSAHLAMGEISPQQIFAATCHKIESEPELRPAGEKFLSEIGWREFSYALLYHLPDLARQNVNGGFDAFPWERPDEEKLNAWRAGRTGYPIVDAGMRELWATGFMHNRVRMVAASFLIKHLLMDWRIGEAWFWDALCDADAANNAASWQWVAGSGADAAPYFRIFNPVLQGEKFDADGAYVRRWLPEIAGLPNSCIHKPWAAPPLLLREADIILGRTYPAPIVDHARARARALAAFERMKATYPA